MNIQKEITTYLHYCKYQKKLSSLSLKAYSIDLRQFLGYLNSVQEQVLSKAIISGFIQELHQKHLPRTAKRKLASLRAFLNYLEFEEILEANPIRKINTKFQEPKQLPRTIPLRLIEQLLTTAFKEQELAATHYASFVALRNRNVLEILFATGVRVSELCSLKKTDVNLDDGTIRIIGKGAKERIIQIENSDVIDSLLHYKNISSSHSDFFLLIG